jgi:hypothetical protein
LASSDTKLASVIGDTFANSPTSGGLDFVANGSVAADYSISAVDTDISLSAFTSSANKLVNGTYYEESYGQISREYAGVFQFRENNKLYLGSFGADE